ncbi:hypothetical protein KIJ96_03410 [Pseudoalteromonas piscicida]|uniref:Uncharacterized protein n=1 Tax=Pseudoalteromonas maricaloris TaxID=184924 RepID=A0A8I2KK94_9GAMM|nr:MULTISPECIES: hypothetical protein [Pseudoalteromonas]NLR20765.1 hypothetical protein [Pseudoalteromonas maricaloris]ODB34063.1 hypothetical protein BB427_20260 [Pseudoalteromonas sp. BMB]UDM62325.1 hypothetical protein KIJ96_03410 [Pseudoalteromonas piscicida]WOX29752.1 hypothetical protein R5H13_05675 [Pseudoalteromonas maricaloris]
MKCPEIKGLEFSERSKQAIAQIKDIEDLGSMLTTAVAASQITTIFVGNNAAVSTINLASTDFIQFSNAMNGAALIPRSALFTIAATTSWKVADNKEKQFWKAVAKGCKVQ